MRQWQTKKMTPETMLKKEIKQILTYTGWFCFHVLQGIGAYPGVPDIIATRKCATLFIEAKSKTGRQSPAQLEFQRRLEAAGGHYVLARSWRDVGVAIQRITGCKEKEVLF
jgi:predicted lipase